MAFISQNPGRRYYNTFRAKIYYKLTYILGKAVMQRFLLTGAANHVLQIGNQWEIQAQKAAINFYTTRTPEYQDYPQLALFPYLVQSLLLKQYKIARKEIVEGEEP